MIAFNSPLTDTLRTGFKELIKQLFCELLSSVTLVAHSSRGLGHLPLKEEITGSNPVCATNYEI